MDLLSCLFDPKEWFGLDFGIVRTIRPGLQQRNEMLIRERYLPMNDGSNSDVTVGVSQDPHQATWPSTMHAQGSFSVVGNAQPVFRLDDDV